MSDLPKHMRWTNSSITALRVPDPEKHIVEKAIQMVFRVLEEGWQGPPFDPVTLAEMNGIETLPSSEVADARTVALPDGKARIEFNPDRPAARVRFSICHEIAHTLFPDFRKAVRNRDPHASTSGDSWQLEALCNRAAAELLLPIGSIAPRIQAPIHIEDVLSLRKTYEASSEAVLLRIARLTTEPLLIFASKFDRNSGRYLVEYAIGSSKVHAHIATGTLLPTNSAVRDCVAIGYTTKGVDSWARMGEVHLECLGVPGYPGEVTPRVVGIARPSEHMAITGPEITFLRGDATRPHGQGRKLILQVVNDQAKSWGRGFPIAIAKRWPRSLHAFTSAVTKDPSLLTLGTIIPNKVDPDTEVVSLVAQRGYGKSVKPRIRYGALSEALMKAADYAKNSGAAVHMPRIGTGEAGGSWFVVEEIIREALLRNGVAVTVYDLPILAPEPRGQLGLLN